MTTELLAYEPALRLAAFSSVFLVMAVWEIYAPRRATSLGRTLRWPNNLGVVVINTLIVRVVFPTGAVAAALMSEANGWGLLNVWHVPQWMALLLSLVILDLVIYLQHVMFHAVPLLWRFHRMHHADLEFDVTTGTRFHPIEIILSAAIKLAAVLLIGAPALAVLIFEILLNATAMFNHANVQLPRRVDAILRWIVVTPDMHRVHHSVVICETNSNYGFNLPWWDRLFGTYRDQPNAGHGAMGIGVAAIRNPEEQRLDRMLTQPFRQGDQSDQT